VYCHPPQPTLSLTHNFVEGGMVVEFCASFYFCLNILLTLFINEIILFSLTHTYKAFHLPKSVSYRHALAPRRASSHHYMPTTQFMGTVIIIAQVTHRQSHGCLVYMFITHSPILSLSLFACFPSCFFHSTGELVCVCWWFLAFFDHLEIGT
jgi:hypothetical protein